MKISPERSALLAKFSHNLDRVENMPEIERIAGLFPRGYISIVASMAGTGKTWLMQYIACQLSLGGEILQGLATTHKSKTLIFSGETGSELLQLRMNKSAWKADSAMIKIYSSIELATHNISCWLNTPEGQENIVTIVANERPDIIFFDTLISFHTVDESKQGDMTAIYVFLARIAKAFNCAVVCNHHTRKRPATDSKRKFTQEDVIGSSAGVRIASSVYVISSQDKPNGGFINTVDNVKAWDKKVYPFTYEFINTPEGVDFNINLNVRPEQSVGDRFFDWVKSLSFGALFTVADVEKHCKCTRYHAQDQIDKLFEYGTIDKAPVSVRGKEEMFYQIVRDMPKVW